MILFASLTIAYFQLGISSALNDLNTKPIDRPAWALRPTGFKFIFAVLVMKLMIKISGKKIMGVREGSYFFV